MTRVKVCGLCRALDVEAAVSAGADYLGFIFAESPRRVSAADAGRIAAGAPVGVERVGVFVNAGQEAIEAAVASAGLTMLQLHGDESPQDCSRCARELGLPVIKALRLRRAGAGELVERYADCGSLLVEPYVEGAYGGTGRQADWELAAELVAAYPGLRFFLAGGLGPDNVAAAVAKVHPYAVDASSDLERAPGIKDPEKIGRYVKGARNR